MTKIKTLNNIENKDEFLNLFKDKELMIYEDIQGSTIFVNWDGNNFTIKPKSLRNEPLNFIDLATQKFYNKAFEFFNNLSKYVTELLSNNWWFCFEYFPDSQPANISYDRLPKNNLILKCIVKGSAYKYDYDEINEYANLFDVEPLPVIFKGKLTGTQLEKIQLFLNTSEKDLKFIFGEKNFAKYFYQLLNPNLENSFLMNSDFNDNLEKLVIKIEGDDDYSFQILNPEYEKLFKDNNTEYVDVYSLILVNFMEFLQLVDFSQYKLTKLTKSELYIELISQLYNEYIENIKDDVINKWIINIPPFFQEDKFKISINFIENNKTKELIQLDPKLEYIFKSILGSFSKEKKKPIGIFNKQTLYLFNSLVKEIDNFLNNRLNINREYKYQRSDVKNFKEFWDLKYNTDADGDIYPDVYDMYDEIESEEEEKKKKKKKEIKGLKNGVNKGPEKGDFDIEKQQL